MPVPYRSVLAAATVCIVSLSAQGQVIYYATPSAGRAVATSPVLVSPVVAPPPAAASTTAAPVVAMPVVAVPVMMQPALVIRSYYRVKKGGRLETVAKRNGVPLADLIRLNPALDAKGPLPAGTLVALPIP